MWRARLIARETTDLSVRGGAVRRPADRRHPDPDRPGPGRPAGRRRPGSTSTPTAPSPTRKTALARRGVWLRHDAGGPATTDVTMTLDTPDALLFDQTLTRIAGDLKRARRHRDPRRPPRPRRRDPRRPPARPGPALRPRHCDTQPRGPRGYGEPLRPPHPRRPGRRPRDGTGTGAASIEKLGAATTRLLTDWLTRFAQAGTKITLRPVLDLNSDAAVDQHDPPPAMRETVLLRDAHCVFPGCRRDSRACDLDHITEYLPIEDGGPPGQTRPRQPRTPVPHPPPRQDPHRLALQTPRRRQLHAGPAPPATSTTSPRPRDCPEEPDRPPPRHHRGHRHAAVSSIRSLRSLPDHRGLRPTLAYALVSRRSLALAPQPPGTCRTGRRVVRPSTRLGLV